MSDLDFCIALCGCGKTCRFLRLEHDGRLAACGFAISHAFVAETATIDDPPSHEFEVSK